MNKRIKGAEYLSNFESIFKCPICDSPMNVFELKSLICSNNHTFDFTKQGYINLTTYPVKTRYSKDLFEARRKLIAEDGFFEPLSQAIAEIINKHTAVKKGTISLIDMGCGEGSGVLVATKSYTHKIWAVADLSKTPFKDKQFDVILNILSPSNYKEFNRLLKADGFVVKVVPQSGYLKELREVIFDKPEKQSYSNVDTVERFNENFQLVDRSRLCYTVTLDNPSIQSLVQMTPLSWATTDKQVKSFLEGDSVQITFDLEILIGKK
ncbi:SAM-dependent methyltransferase [Kroppenstedtia pulmonis]|uniref:SAM-dependent methyltransferase n=1 Tax=Kroppenstedtia pulmonis TaxID=1380685 RepID=A0A7D3Y765_9BACL|nr:SAM-dependent methyltransferase [Kroppenstedtia pulmonis]QKG85965.1 SAM-dependent methyltransferase [Kroppenstedtia pulmonis]